MSPFKVILWPIINLVKVTGLMPLTMKNGFSASKSAQCVSLLMILCYITFGSVTTIRFIFIRDNATPVVFIQLLGLLLTTCSAVATINYLILKAENVAELLNKLEIIFNDLRSVSVTQIAIRVWLQFFIVYFVPLLYIMALPLKNNTKCAGNECVINVFLKICNVAKTNCAEASIVFFLSLGQIINELFKALLKELAAATSNSNIRKRKARYLILMKHHQKIYECAEKLNSLFGILLLLSLITSNIFFQTTVFTFLHDMCSPKSSNAGFLETFSASILSITHDLGRITLPFIICHSISVQVF